MKVEHENTFHFHFLCAALRMITPSKPSLSEHHSRVIPVRFQPLHNLTPLLSTRNFSNEPNFSLQSQTSQFINQSFNHPQNVDPSFRRYRKVFKRRKELCESSPSPFLANILFSCSQKTSTMCLPKLWKSRLPPKTMSLSRSPARAPTSRQPAARYEIPQTEDPMQALTRKLCTVGGQVH
jgi:hypothetical protein